MRRYSDQSTETSALFVGVDVHCRQWHVTVMTREQIVFSGRIDGTLASLRQVLARWERSRLTVGYEAGFSGFWLQRALAAEGMTCVVIPPSRLPVESGNHIKTDRRDSAKLATVLSHGVASPVWIPSLEQQYDREVVRQRHRLVRDRRRVQCQIKSLLYCYGAAVPARWSQATLAQLAALRLPHQQFQASLGHLLLQYRQLSELLAAQTRQVKALAATEPYGRRVALLGSLPGVGLLTAVELLVELGDWERFARAEQLSAYVGLTPSQFSSGEHVRLGHITRAGKAHLRAVLIEAAWLAIRHDRHLADVYARLKAHTGGKKAIVGIARRLLLMARAVLRSSQPYRLTA